MKIAECFSSLQGEGRNQGRPCHFIRFAGCNLRCRWCDTPASQRGGREISPDSVLEQIPQDTWYVCITGGEPLLQAEDLGRLLIALKSRGILVDIETNGTRNFSRFLPYASICMDVKCPSSGEESDLSLLKTIRPEDSVKFVVSDAEDCRYVREVLHKYTIAGEVFISPVSGVDYHPVIDFVRSCDTPVRFQIQLHKILGVP